MAIDQTQAIVNDELYRFEINFKRLNDDADPNAEPAFEIAIENDHINQLEFGIDLFEPVIKGTLSYTDVSYSTFPFIRHDGNCFMDVRIHRLRQTVEGQSINEMITVFDHVFLITDVKLEDRSDEEGLYTVSFISINWFNFNNNVIYSSVSNKRATDMMREMLV